MILTIDIGGTYTKYGYVCADKVFEKGKWKTVFSFDALCEKIKPLVKANTEKICISSGGFWDKNGNSLGYETIPETAKYNLVQFLKEKYKIPVFIENDARCALLCEKKYGALRNCENAVLFVLGTSVGSAVLADGKLYAGAHKTAGMFFKMPESLEPYRYEYAANTVTQANIYKDQFSLACCNMQDIEAYAVSGEPAAQKILSAYAKAVAKKILFAKLLYDPEKIVIGGGIANSQNILDDILKAYRDLLHTVDEEDNCPIEKTVFGENSNLIGATFID